MSKMTKRTKVESTSIYPKPIQSMLKTAHRRGMDSKAAAKRINESKAAAKYGVSYSYRQIATALGNLTRGYCKWA